MILAIRYRDGSQAAIEMSDYIAALFVMAPPDDVAGLRVLGDLSAWVRSHVPFTPYAEHPDNQRGREMADAN